jgi:chromosome segregation ATPase
MLDSETDGVDVLTQKLSERAEIIVDLHGQLALAQGALSERTQRLEELSRELERTRASAEALEARHDALVRENGRVNERLLDLEDVARARSHEIEALKRVCDERLAEIDRISLEAERRSTLLADMTAAFEAALRRLEQLGAGGSATPPRTGGS